MGDDGNKLTGAEKPVLETGGTQEVKPEIKPETPLAPITDFKVAEIWIRSGQIMLDASESFWSDRCRALGVLEFCKDIVKTAQPPKKPNIIIPGNSKMLNFVRGLGKRRKR